MLLVKPKKESFHISQKNPSEITFSLSVQFHQHVFTDNPSAPAGSYTPCLQHIVANTRDIPPMQKKVN